jgi:hypothetical protein
MLRYQYARIDLHRFIDMHRDRNVKRKANTQLAGGGATTQVLRTAAGMAGPMHDGAGFGFGGRSCLGE